MDDTLAKPDRTWDVLCHLSALAVFIIPFGNIVGPLIVWLIKRGSVPSVDEHGKEALNFQISMTIYAVAGAAISAVLMLVLIGFILLPLVLVAIFIANIVLIVMASVSAGNGELYRYPFSIRLIS